MLNHLSAFGNLTVFGKAFISVQSKWPVLPLKFAQVQSLHKCGALKGLHLQKERCSGETVSSECFQEVQECKVLVLLCCCLSYEGRED